MSLAPNIAAEEQRAAELAGRHRDAVKTQIAKAEAALRAARVASKAAAELASARAHVRRLAAEAAHFDEVDLEATDEPAWRREDFAALDAYLEAGPSRPIAVARAAREAADREHRAGQARLVEDFVRQGRDSTLDRIDADHRDEALRRRSEVVERIRARDRDEDAGVPPGLRSAFPRVSRLGRL